VPTPETKLLQGTLDMLILKALSLGPLHGYGIGRRIMQMSGEVLRVEEGSLYPALHRLEDKGFVEAKWGVTDTKRQAKFYALTPRGRLALRAEIDSWSRFSDAIAKVITAKRQPA